MKGYEEAQKHYDNLLPDEDIVCEECGQYECECDHDDFDYEPDYPIDGEYDGCYFDSIYRR